MVKHHNMGYDVVIIYKGYSNGDWNIFHTFEFHGTHSYYYDHIFDKLQSISKWDNILYESLKALYKHYKNIGTDDIDISINAFRELEDISSMQRDVSFV